MLEGGDVLIGMTIRFSSANDRRPRRIGFTLIRGGKIYQIDTIGNRFGYGTFT